jgi:predicted nucleotidyltransferase
VISVRKYLRVLQDRGVTVRFGVVFGSQACGTAEPTSDIDLLVVSPRFDRSYKRREINMLWHVAADTDSRIEPLPCGEKEWETDDESAIIEIARREGKIIKVA